MDKGTFWATKNPGAEYEAITFTHPVFADPIRLVASKFATVTLAGNAHTPAPMTIKVPDAKTQTQPKLQIAFPRQVVGRQFKQQLKLVKASGSRAPIGVKWELYLGETDAPKASWELYASDKGGVIFTPSAVQVAATLDNPATRQAALIYTPDVFTGLETV